MLNNLQREVPLPDGLTRWIVQLAVGEHIDTSWARAVFDLRGGLYLEELNVWNAGTNEIILNADTIRVNWAPLNLVLGVFPPFEEIHATGMVFHSPASLSPTGLNEPVAKISQAHIYEEDGQLMINDLLAAVGGVNVVFSGSGPLRIPRMEARDPDTVNRIRPLLADILRLTSQINADCRIRWNGAQRRSHHFSLVALSDALVLPALTLHNLHGSARLETDGSSLALTSLNLEARLAAIKSVTPPNLLSSLPLKLPAPVTVEAGGPPASTRWGTVPSRLDILIRKPFEKRLPVSLFNLQTSFLETDHTYHWSASGPGLFAVGSARPFAPPDAQDGFPFRFSFRAHLQHPTLADFFPKLPDHRLINGANAGFIRFTGNTTPDKRLTGSLVSDHLFIGETRFSHIRAHLDLSSSNLHLSRIHVQKTANESASGSYSQHFPSSRFALNARGAIFPQSLDALLGLWWQRIFTRIHADSPLSGDVAVWGQWRDETSLRSVTAVEGSGARYRGIAVPNLGVRVRSNGDWAYLDALEARFGEQRVTGEIAWQQGLGDNVRRPVRIRFRSNAAWEIVQQASGVDGLQALDVEGAPDVFVEGTLWRPARDATAEDKMIPDLRLGLQNPNAAFGVSGLDLNSMQFEGTLVGNALSLKAVSGRLAEGVFTGRVDIRNWANPDLQERHLRLQIFDADYTETLRQVSGLLDNPGEVRESLLKDEEGGKLDADIDLLIRPELTQSEGSGRITLRNGKVGEIHMFGGLSRALSTMGLGFSTLDLKTASLEWALKDGTLAIPQCLVTGPVLNIQLNGDMEVENKQLSMRAEATFFRGLVSKVLTPVSDNFQFDVTGTLANPNWQIRLNPFRWFQNRLGGSPEPDPPL